MDSHLTNTLIDAALAAKKLGRIDPTAQGWSWAEDPLDAETLQELIAEVLPAAADVQVCLEDARFSHEYGISGDRYLAVQHAIVVIELVDAPAEIPSLPQFSEDYPVADDYVTIDWHLLAATRRDGNTYLVYRG